MSTLSNEELARHLVTIYRGTPTKLTDLPSAVRSGYLALAHEVLRLMEYTRRECTGEITWQPGSPLGSWTKHVKPITLPPEDWQP